MHFKCHKDLMINQRAHGRCQFLGGTKDRLFFTVKGPPTRHTFDNLKPDGSVAVVSRHALPTTIGTVLLPAMAIRQVEATIQEINRLGYNLDDVEITLHKMGRGLDSHYISGFRYRDRLQEQVDAGVEKLGRDLETAVFRGKGDFTAAGLSLNIEDWQQPEARKAKAPEAPLQAVCRCSMTDLMSQGHDPGCPEKR